MTSLKKIVFLILLFMLACGCGGVDGRHEQASLISKTLVPKKSDPLGIIARGVRARFEVADGYRIKYSKDHGYQGEYLEFSREGKVILEAMRLPFEKNDYVISIYGVEFMSEKDKFDLCLIVSDSFSKNVCEGWDEK